MPDRVSYYKGKIDSPSMVTAFEYIIEGSLASGKDRIFKKVNTGTDGDKFVKNTTYTLANQIHPKIFKFFKQLFLEHNLWELPMYDPVNVDFVDLINYQVEDHLDWHIDSSYEQYSKSIIEYKWAVSDFNHGNSKNKKLSITVCLSDKQSYDGGVFEIADMYKPGIAFAEQLDKFEYVIFPSCLPHRVTPITKGQRWAIATWANGPEFA